MKTTTYPTDPLTKPWAIAARRAVKDALQRYQDSKAAGAELKSAIDQTNARIQELNALIEAAKTPKQAIAPVATLKDVDAALTAISAEAERLTGWETEVALLTNKIPMLESLLTKAGDQLRRTSQSVGEAQRLGWLALADSMKPHMLEAADVIRRWRLAMREAGHWPHEARDIADEFLEGESADNDQTVAELTAWLGLPEEA